ncbi:hypothetical protein CDO52_04345 [Nocardiopsis gilva YIM 90087]|uniref:Peptidase S8 n=1 Tax=Nocardiopsis gilva YIM 90087 TaxID=1235441 RepID=A0A223S1V9_9ACTN|nr:PatA/PatG family cyanobactin maturation protease [Nocardiopsis gilva]ASU82113.1 hypothetical protein CDO52_04345 [Nocardiopsis gilva YIM 90087]
MGKLSIIPGLSELWRLTKGDDRVGVAVVDGRVGAGHPAFAGSGLASVEGVWPSDGATGAKAAHGTSVAGVLFGQHDGPVPGVAPGCRKVSVPAFSDRWARTSQLDLARGIELALDEGVHVINISGGQLASAEEAEDPLARAVRRCKESNVLVVAAAGNDGCFCDHVPAALPSVLAVGALDDEGRPLPSSNWGPGNTRQGILAPGQNIPVPVPGGGVALQTGTSLAAPVVSGVAALLLSLQLRDGREPDPRAIGELLMTTADPCDLGDADACARFLNGKLNITKAVTTVTSNETDVSVAHSQAEPVSPIPETATGRPEQAVPSCDCGCDQAPAAAATVPTAQAALQAPTDPAAAPATTPAAGSAAVTLSSPAPAPVPSPAPAPPPAPTPPPQATSTVTTSSDDPARVPAQRLAYAQGVLGYDFATEARRDSFKQLMAPVEVGGAHVPANPYDPNHMVAHLRENPSESSALIWTLNLDLTPIYAIEPNGGYTVGVYERLVDFLSRQLECDDGANFVDRVSIPGKLPGRTVKLFSGQEVPVVEVELKRGLYGWSVTSLANAVAEAGAAGAKKGNPSADTLRAAVAEFLTRVYYDLRNFGATSRDRALNFAATNAVQARDTLAQALSQGLALQDIDVEKSPFARPDSDCWDVKLRFFDPENSRRAKRVYRFTVDVKDVMPVTVGDIRSWPES